MLVKKSFETVVNLSAIEQYADIDTVIWDHLRRRYEGRCKASSLILRIVQIDRRSTVQMAKNRLDGGADVSVHFTAEVVTYAVNEIITGCQIIQVEDSGSVLCSTDHAVITIRGNSNLQSLKPKLRMTVIVRAVEYPEGSKVITINALPYSYNEQLTTYHLSGTSTPEQLQVLKAKLARVKTAATELSSSDQRIVSYIRDVYYRYQTVYAPPKSVIGDIIDLADALLADSNAKLPEYLSRPPWIEKSQPVVLINGPVPEATIMAETPAVALLHLLDDYGNYARMLVENALIYSSESAIGEHNSIWGMYRRLKKELPPAAKETKKTTGKGEEVEPVAPAVTVDDDDF